MGKIGLVTVLYKSDEVLEGFFRSIAIQDFKNYILYIIDNSVNDKTNLLLETLSRQYPSVERKHIKNKENTGVAAGNNTGIRLALADDCSHVLLLNNDIEIEQSFLLGKMLAIAEEKGEVLIVPKILYYSNRKIWMAGGHMDKFRALGVHNGMNKTDIPKFNIPKHVTYSPTCFMLIAKSVFDKVGIVDEKYFAYYDDTDFIFRAVALGYKIYYEPSLVILHKVSTSVGVESPFYVYYSNRNKIYFIRKNFRGFYRWFAIGYTFLARTFFWLRYNSEKRKSLIKGIVDGFKIPVEKP